MKSVKSTILRYLGAILLCAAAISMTGCTGADISALNAIGQPHIIKQYSGGQVVGQWESTGMIHNEAQSDGYYFQDAATNKLVMVSGTVQITVK